MTSNIKLIDKHEQPESDEEDLIENDVPTLLEKLFKKEGILKEDETFDFHPSIRYRKVDGKEIVTFREFDIELTLDQTNYKNSIDVLFNYEKILISNREKSGGDLWVEILANALQKNYGEMSEYIVRYVGQMYALNSIPSFEYFQYLPSDNDSTDSLSELDQFDLYWYWAMDESFQMKLSIFDDGTFVFVPPRICEIYLYEGEEFLEMMEDIQFYFKQIKRIKL